MCEPYSPNPATSSWHSEFEPELGRLTIVNNQTAGLLATALIELSGNFILKQHEVDKLSEVHDVIIQETFGFKHLVKELVIASAILDDEDPPAAREAIDGLFKMSDLIFSSWLKPDLGFFVTGSPALAYTWRLRQSGGTGVIEDYGLASRSGQDSFISLQTDCNRIFAEYAGRNEWATITMEDRATELNEKNAIELIRHSIARFKERGTR